MFEDVLDMEEENRVMGYVVDEEVDEVEEEEVSEDDLSGQTVRKCFCPDKSPIGKVEKPYLPQISPISDTSPPNSPTRVRLCRRRLFYPYQFPDERWMTIDATAWNRKSAKSDLYSVCEYFPLVNKVNVNKDSVFSDVQSDLLRKMDTVPNTFFSFSD